MNKFESYYADKFEFKNLDLSLSRIDNALKEAGFNEKSLGRIIHIAGTNGKGSTSYFLYQMLQLSGYKTALFTSPHILKINERISYNLSDISDDNMDNIFNQYKDLIIKNNLSYFEAVFFTAVMYFALKSPDFTILETGLGGRFDATNVIKTNLCSIITQIDLDHTERLGKTREEIAFEKAQALLGKRVEVLIDEFDQEDGTFVGHTKFLSPSVDFGVKIIDNNNIEVGNIVSATLTGFDGNFYKGEIL